MNATGTSIDAHPQAYPAGDAWLSVSGLKNALALAYLATSIAPALYLPPLMLALMLALAVVEVVFLKVPNGRAPYVRPLLALLAFMFASALLSGLGPMDIFSYDAIRYDANIIYSAIPLLVLGSGDFDLRRLDRWIPNIIVWGAIAYVSLPLVGFHPYESHNAAGGFFMVLLAYVVGRAIVDGFGGRWVTIIVGALALVLTDSRGSILAILSAVAYHWGSQRWPRLMRGLLLAAIATLIAGLAAAYYVWQEMGAPIVYDYGEFFSVAEQLPTDMTSLGERPGTIMHRLFLLYPMAVDMFLQSPFIGIGFTRFDDFPIEITGNHGVLALNTASFAIHSNLHAHNSYLHIAAENGLVGLLLLFLTIRSIYRSFVSPALFIPAAMIIGSLLFASLTEHRLTTPSQAAPAFVIIGLLWACQRGQRP